MKTIAIAVLLTLTSTMAAAKSELSEDQILLCSLKSQRADLVMTVRQENYPMQELLSWPGANTDEAINEIVTAYQQPLADTSSERVATIRKFREDTLKECLKSL